MEYKPLKKRVCLFLFFLFLFSESAIPAAHQCRDGFLKQLRKSASFLTRGQWTQTKKLCHNLLESPGICPTTRKWARLFSSEADMRQGMFKREFLAYLKTSARLPNKNLSARAHYLLAAWYDHTRDYRSCLDEARSAINDFPYYYLLLNRDVKKPLSPDSGTPFFANIKSSQAWRKFKSLINLTKTDSPNIITTLQSAREKMQGNRRFLLIEIRAPWCDDCDTVDMLLADPRVAAVIKARFVLVKVNIGYLDRNLSFIEKYEISAIPAFVIEDGNGDILDVKAFEPVTRGEKPDAEKLVKYFEGVLKSNE